MSEINSSQIKGGGGGGGFITVPFSYLSASPLILQTVMGGQLVYESSVVITTPFNDPAATFQVGITATPGLVFGINDVDIVAINQYDNEQFVTIPSNDILIATISPGISTQGAGIIYYNIK